MTTALPVSPSPTPPPVNRKTRRLLSRRGRIVAGTVAALALLATATLAVGRVTFNRRMSDEAEQLLAANRDTEQAVVTEADLAGLPEPVQRWLRHSGVVGKERTATVRLQQEGDFRLGEDKGWMPYTAEQYFTTNPPGFIWEASFEMAPLLSIHGRDLYRDGIGDIEMRVLSLIPVADKRGGLLDQGSLLRYLGEIVWFPAAALRPYISWETVDDNSARATMTNGDITASATFTFDEQGQVVNVLAVRNNDARSKPELWSIPITAWGEFEGVRVPVAGDGVWKYDTGDFTYIHWRITDIQFNQHVR